MTIAFIIITRKEKLLSARSFQDCDMQMRFLRISSVKEPLYNAFVIVAGVIASTNVYARSYGRHPPAHPPVVIAGAFYGSIQSSRFASTELDRVTRRNFNGFAHSKHSVADITNEFFA